MISLKRITLLAGGTGSVKLVRGFSKIDDVELTIISNVGDNIWLHGLYICPDLDTILYGLSGLLDTSKGWGVSNDTFDVLDQLNFFGQKTWFNLGDRDLALHLVRTNLLNSGISLTDIIANLSKILGIQEIIIPSSNQPIETHVETDQGDIHLQEYWVKHNATPKVLAVKYKGADNALPSPGVIDSIQSADKIIICPGNPITSILPILAIKNIRSSLVNTSVPVIALSPILNKTPINGPAGLLMASLNIPVSSLGVAKLYSDFLNTFIAHTDDFDSSSEINNIGAKLINTDILMKSDFDEERLARLMLRL